jgi:hypothetical protein
MPNKCPYCDYETPSQEEGGGERMWQEIAHMQTEHPEIISERLREVGMLDMDTGFGIKKPEPSVIYIPGDMSIDDLRLLVQIVADANKATGLKNEQIQRIETALDATLMELERTYE